MNAAERIEGNDALLTEILVMLPPKSVFRFMSVSKRWNCMIKDPFFLKSYSKLRRSSGDGRLLALFQRKSMVRTIPKEPIQMNILPIRGIRQPNLRNEHVPKTGLGAFMNSSNGLILCTVRHVRYYEVPTKYTVLNPMTKKFVTLPTPPTKSRRLEEYFSSFDGLMCEENTAALKPNYIVVRVCDFTDKVMQIETYSSKTGEWAPSTLLATDYISQPLYMPPVVVNGVFHWFTVCYNLAVYDPNKCKNHLQLIDAPCSTGGNYSSVTVTRSQFPDDILWYGAIKTTGLRFWKLGKGEDGSYKRDTTLSRDGWILMHNIQLTSLHRGIKIDRSKECLFHEFGIYKVDVGFDGVVSRDPLVVLLKWRETWFLYNFETNTSELVRYRGRLLSGDYYRGTLRPFSESCFLSSYAL